MNDTITINGHTYTVETEYDLYNDPPWEQCDGYGVVSDWVYRNKRPGERVLAVDDHRSDCRRFYDVQATMRIARRDRWGLSQDELVALARRLKRKPTADDILSQAVANDFDFLRRWCNGEWHYVTVTVTDLDTGKYESTGGVEDIDDDTVWSVAKELADVLDADLHPDDHAARRLLAARTNRHDILTITRAFLR